MSDRSNDGAPHGAPSRLHRLAGGRGASLLAAVAVAVASSACLTSAATAATAPSVLTSVLGVPGQSGVDGSGAPATRTRLVSPTGIALDAAGNTYVANAGASDVLEVLDGVAYVIAGSPGQRGDGTSPDPDAMVSPTGLAFLPGGTLLIADPGAHVIWQYTDGTVSLWAGTGADAPATDGLVRTASAFEAPTGLAVDGAGTVYVSDAADDTIWAITTDGVVHHLAGASGQPGFAGDGGSAAAARLDDPTGLVWDANHLLVADTGNQRIRSVTPDGRVGTAAGPAGLDHPVGLAVDDTAGTPTVLVADSGDGRVLTLGGGGVSTLVGGPADGLSPDGTLAAQARLDAPVALAVPSRGRVLVAESAGSVVRQVGPAVTVPDQPAAPAAATGNGRAHVSWTVPDDGGSPITSWILREYEGPLLVASVTVVGTTGIDVQGLSDGVPYTFTVTAVNANGDSPESEHSAAAVPAGPQAVGIGAPPTVPATPAAPTTSAPAAPTPTPAQSAAPAPVASTDSGFHSTSTLVPGSVPGAYVTPTPTAMPVAAAPTRAPAASAPAALVPTVPTTPGGPTAAPTATTLAAPPAQLVPVHSFADAATDVATVGRKTAIPLVLIGLLVAFLLLQGVVDRRDPKLANAPLHAERGLEFGPA